ncbi:MAG: hypothetical protein WD772_06025 [Pseudohongiellaceae bacterium]
MRGLAEFVMKGRKQAILAVVLIGVIPLIYFISPIIVGLVILRKGPREGGLLLAWASLPILAWIAYPAIVFDTIGNLLPLIVLLAVAGLAVVLRTSGSWQFTLLFSVAVGLICDVYLRIQPLVIEILLLQINPLLELSGSREPVTREELITLVAVTHMGMAILLLMASRWMQAMLYQPGGFRKEFHELRIERRAALPLLVMILLSGFGILVPETWLLYFTLPLLVAGTALVHATIALRRMSGLWLLAFYTVYPVIVQFLVLFAMVDSWYDFRKHMPAAPPGGNST